MSFQDWLSAPIATATVATSATPGPVSTQTVARVATVAVADATGATLEAVAERAAIMEYDAGIPRAEAERLCGLK